MTIERRLSPEEEELRTKQADLDSLLDRLAQNELDLETLHAEINSFFSAYNAAVLPKVAEAKGLRARIAQAIYVLDPTDTARSESQEARSSADEAARDRQGQAEAPKDAQPGQRESFTPSPELRALYIDLVKKAHPDLGKDDEDRLRRNGFMVRVNQAYEEGDEAALRSLAVEWAAGADPMDSGSVGERLVRLIRQIADVRSRLVTAEAEIESVKNSDDYLLVKEAEEARLEGRNLTAEHVTLLDADIDELKAKINNIKDRLLAM